MKRTHKTAPGLKQPAARARFERLYRVIRDHLGLNVSRIAPRVTRRLFLGEASVRNCDGKCCRGGTTVSIDERDRVMAHAALVSRQMTSRARGDASRWFDARMANDADFTAGRATSTRVLDGACVFYRTDGLCALQVAGEKSLGNPWALKPAVCLLWPLAVQDGALDAGYAWFTRRRECCAPVRTGEKTILQVIQPDENLIKTCSRPKNSRGGGPSLGR
jgi:hypothetical protein